MRTTVAKSDRQQRRLRGLRARIIARGAPEAAAAMLLGLYAASRKGEFATVDPTLEGILGRSPITMRHLLAEKAGGLGALAQSSERVSLNQRQAVSVKRGRDFIGPSVRERTAPSRAAG